MKFIKINGETVKSELCSKLISQKSIELSNEEFIQVLTTNECFELTTDDCWPFVIHDCEKDDLYYFKDEKFKAHHFASKEFFQEAIVAYDGIKCESCNLYHRNIEKICELCKKYNLKNS